VRNEGRRITDRETMEKMGGGRRRAREAIWQLATGSWRQVSSKIVENEEGATLLP
jgi:hypothetical protein